MAEPYLGEIQMFGGNFAPRGWMFCNGQLLPIQNNEALFALIGTTYGGDGTTTFALPDLRGRAPIHQGFGGGASYVIGQAAGTETVTLLASDMPAHTHGLQASTAPATSTDPAGRSLASSTALDAYTSSGDALVAMNVAAIGNAGNGLPHENMAPYVAINFIIALEGIFPSRP
jgi:microcystin-dependent protein